MLTSIVIPTYNHLDDYLKPCLESIIRYTDLSAVEVIVVANGCTDATASYLAELSSRYPSIKPVIDNNKLGYTKATNLGLRMARGEFVVFLNNDTILLHQQTHSWINRLIEPMINDSSVGVTGCKLLHNHESGYWFAVFFCAATRRKLVEEIGYLNEEYSPGSGEDIEFCIEAQKRGLKVLLTNNIREINGVPTGDFPIYHKAEGTMHDDEHKPGWGAIFERNMQRIKEKYGQSDIWLSILICTMPERKEQLEKLIASIRKSSELDKLEILTDDDTSITVGEKRNRLISRAKGRYVVFIDDDDSISDKYVHLVLRATELNQDCIGIKLIKTTNGQDPQLGVASNRFTTWLEFGKYAFRPINHINPVRLEIARNVKFEHISYGEDRLYSRQLKQYIKTETMIDEPIYFYDYAFSKSLSVKADIARNKEGLAKVNEFDRDNKIRFNLGCGNDFKADYINIDLYADKVDIKMDIGFPDLPDNTADEILASHVIEHWHFQDIWRVLGNWYKLLKPGGKIEIETPDFFNTCKHFIDTTEEMRIHLYGHIFSTAWVPGQAHLFLFTEQQLIWMMQKVGFRDVRRIPAASNYVRNYPWPDIFLRVEAFK